MPTRSTSENIVEVGSWDSDLKQFDSNGAAGDAVRVSATLEDEPLFFARALGQETFTVPRAAIAQGGGDNLDIILTLDLSGSMGSQGRIQALQTAAPEFINVIEEVGDSDRIGVMGYGAIGGYYDPAAQGHTGVPYLDSPANLFPDDSYWVAVREAEITSDLAFLRASILNSTVLVSNKYNGWTPIGAAIRDSAHYLNAVARPGVARVIVLMSDGHANKPSGNGPGYAREMADYAATLDIKVHTISLGNAADEDLMDEIAAKTGGNHFVASGSSKELPVELTKAFRLIAEELKRTQLVQ